MKLVIAHTFQVDSDEVTWSVMVDQILYNKKHFLFFTDQNFRGSIEAYLLLPFQLLFGVNFYTLRVVGVVLGVINTFLLAFSVKKVTNDHRYALLSGVIYWFSLTEIMLVMTKSWGSYVLIQTVMLIMFYLFPRVSLSKSFFRLAVFGTILGFSFWANEQSIYFIFVILGCSLIVDLLNIRATFTFLATTSSPENPVVANMLLWIPASAITFFSFYLIARKRMAFAPVLTIVSKFQIGSFSNYTTYFVVELFYIIIFGFVLLLLTQVVSKVVLNKTGNSFMSIFAIIGSFTLIAFLINIYYDSFSRVSGGNLNLKYSYIFFAEIIAYKMYGHLWYIVILLGLIVLIKRALNFRQNVVQLQFLDLFIVSFFAFPIMFILSGLPSLTSTPRYLILWYPVSILLSVYGIKILTDKFVTSIRLRKVVPIFLVIFWLVYWVSDSSNLLSYYKIRTRDQVYYSRKIAQYVTTECVGDYWEVGPIMFYSGLRVKCYTNKEFKTHYKFLDVYNPTLMK